MKTTKNTERRGQNYNQNKRWKENGGLSIHRTSGEHSTGSSSVELLEDLSDSSLESSDEDDSSSSDDLWEEMGDSGTLELDAGPMEDWWVPVGVPNTVPDARGRPALAPTVPLALGKRRRGDKIKMCFEFPSLLSKVTEGETRS